MTDLEGHVQSLHHITVGVAGAQDDVSFVQDVLGQRFLKATVLFDGRRPVYHLYYGDRIGRGGTIFTTFPWRKIGLKGRKGSGQIKRTVFSVPEDSVSWWEGHLKEHGTTIDGVGERFGQRYVQFQHPSGLELEVIGAADDREAWTGSGVAEPGNAIRGLHSVTLGLLETQNTKEFLELLGFRQTGEDGATVRMEVGEGGSSRTIDLTAQPDVPPGTWTHASGIHHHVAPRPTARRTSWPSRTTWRATATSTSPSRRTASTSSRSTSAAPAGSSSRSPRRPTTCATSRSPSSAATSCTRRGWSITAASGTHSWSR